MEKRETSINQINFLCKTHISVKCANEKTAADIFVFFYPMA
jgi:hypothetical protein